MNSGHPPPHVPVMEQEVLTNLLLEPGKIYVDGTLGLGGHSSSILQACGPDGQVIGFEWDENAIAFASQRLEKFGQRFVTAKASYATLLTTLRAMDIQKIDGLLLDLGVSSLQLDTGERGFSFRFDAPLDMRMGSGLQTTAADIINTASEEDLADIFFNYGEERQARRIASHVTAFRKREAINTTKQLATVVALAIPKRYHPKKIHVATKVFQALRIAVNKEFDNLVTILNDAPQVLNSGARVCIITFHSIEDRITKQAFTKNPSYQLLASKPIIPSPMEIANNPRSRSAKLRVAIRV